MYRQVHVCCAAGGEACRVRSGLSAGAGRGSGGAARVGVSRQQSMWVAPATWHRGNSEKIARPDAPFTAPLRAHVADIPEPADAGGHGQLGEHLLPQLRHPGECLRAWHDTDPAGPGAGRNEARHVACLVRAHTRRMHMFTLMHRSTWQFAPPASPGDAVGTAAHAQLQRRPGAPGAGEAAEPAAAAARLGGRVGGAAGHRAPPEDCHRLVSALA